MRKDGADILCIQETKAWEEQLPPEVGNIGGYYSYFAEARRKGYSGTALYSKSKPLEVSDTFHPDFDDEGRFLMARYPDMLLLNVYFPNGKASPERLQYKMDFYAAFLEYVERKMAQHEHILIAGDVNTAHREIDLARPKENSTTSGFLPKERAWIDRLLESGFHDTFRMFCTEHGQYSYWDLRTRARERNVGWRIDYIFASHDLADCVRDAFILGDIHGSDHCPVGIELRHDG